MKVKSKNKQKRKKYNLLKIFSNILIIAGVALLVLIFYSPIVQELNYFFQSQKSKVKSPASTKRGEQNFNSKFKIEETIPVSMDFGIVIPKINANAKIFPNINPFDEKEFLPVLKKGVAHAKGTFFPGQGKNIYLFAHSTDAFYNVGRYNAVFFLLDKLNKGDGINIYYKDNLYSYIIFEKKIINADNIDYLKISSEEILTLQTCYPPGTTLRRLIVKANQVGKW